MGMLSVMLTRALALLSLLHFAACGGGDSPDAATGDGAVDTGSPGDAGTPDAPVTDAAPDTGGPPVRDGGPLPTECGEPALYVAMGGRDDDSGTIDAPLASIQAGLDAATAGTTVCVRGGTYAERLTVNVSGSAGAWVTVMPHPGEHVTVTGEGAGGGTEDNLVYLEGRSFVRILGLELRGAGTVSDASGIRVFGSGDHIELRGNELHEVRGTDAMGITVYGSDGAGITDIVIDGNDLHDLEPAMSETLVVNGNVRRFAITNNSVRDSNNIGIDVIGGEAWLSTAFPDEGLIAGNTVTRANSVYDGSAACIYSDGASNLVIERNRVSGCDFGIEIGAENPGVVTQNVVVRSNFVFDNFRGGIIFGGFDRGRGRVRDSAFVHNTLYRNGRPAEATPFGYDGSDNGEIIVQWAEDCVIAGNILSGIEGTTELVQFWADEAPGIVLSNNIGDNPGEPADLAGEHIFVDPMLVDPAAGDLHLMAASPAVGAAAAHADRGDEDIDGEARVQSAADIGADER